VTELESIFQRAFDQAPYLTAILVGPELRFRYANPLYLATIRKTDVVGLPLKAVMPELEGQGILELLADIYATGEAFRGDDVPVELERDGRLDTVYFTFTYQPLRAPDGQVEGILVTAADVTRQNLDRLGAEEARQQIEERRRLLEAQVVERTQDLQVANEELMAQSEELESQQAELEAINAQLYEQAEELQRQRDMVARIIDHANTGISYMNRDLVYEWVNPEQARAWAKAIPDIIGRSVQDVFQVGPDAEIVRLLRQVVETGEAYADSEFAFELHTPAGPRTTYWDFTYQPVKAGGEVIGVLVVALEVSDRVERQRMLRGVLDSSTSGIVACEAVRDAAGAIRDFRFVLANPTSERMLFYTADQMLGRTLLELFPGNVESGLFERYVQVTETGEPMEVETFYQDDRLAFWLSVCAVKVHDGVAITFTDITDRKRIELEAAAHSRELAHQKAFAERIIANATSGICYLDRDLVYRVANPVYCDFLQLPPDAIIGKYLFDVVPGGEDTILPIFRAALDEGRPHHVTALPFAYDLPDGSKRQTYWDAVYLPMTGSDGKSVEGVLVLANEVSTRIENERLQQEKIDVLEQANIHKEQFLSILSHELRTPINAIMGFASVLDDDVAGPLTELQHAYLQKILASSDRMLALINDLLDMSRIQAGRFSVTMGSVDLAGLCRDAAASVGTLANQGELTLRVEMAPDLPPVPGDAQRLEQILVNLLSNATKFTPAGGSIALRASHQGQRLRVEVADSGIGIAEEHQERIFDPFTQVDMSNTRRSGGTGLGLSISKALVEAHGGTIGVESEVGRGSTFWFELPL
jgi:PAS domain S-box-containing protein